MSANSGPMYEPVTDPDAYTEARAGLLEVLALGGVGAITQATRDAELRELRRLVPRYPEHARILVAELGQDHSDPPEPAA